MIRIIVSGMVFAIGQGVGLQNSEREKIQKQQQKHFLAYVSCNTTVLRFLLKFLWFIQSDLVSFDVYLFTPSNPVYFDVNFICLFSKALLFCQRGQQEMDFSANFEKHYLYFSTKKAATFLQKKNIYSYYYTQALRFRNLQIHVAMSSGDQIFT